MMKKRFGLFVIICFAITCVMLPIRVAAQQDSAFMDLAKKRFSVRQFADKPVPKDLLLKVLEAATSLRRQRISSRTASMC